MYILSETNGQTCNKFFQYLYYLKLCVRKGIKLRVQLPDKTIGDYPNLVNNSCISFPFYSPIVSRLFGVKKSLWLTRWFTVLFLNNYVRFVLHQLSFHRLCFLSGKPTWAGTNEEYSDMRPLLQYLFLLKDSLKVSVDRCFCQQDVIFCGIHMRGGDYKRWLNGRYYFDQITYRKAMDKFISLLPQKKIKFFICSNEPIQRDVFAGLEYFIIDNATASQDIYALSRCDYIIGTLSSFNAWSSLLGGVPLFTLLKEEEAETLTLNDFSPVVNYKKKENGWTFPRNATFFSKLSHPWLYRHSNKEYRIKLNYE